MPPTINMGIPGASSSVTGGLTGKRVLLAEPRGYCAGVDRAVETVERALEKHGAPVYVRHEIVHNRHVVDTLAKAGAVFVDETEMTQLHVMQSVTPGSPLAHLSFGIDVYQPSAPVDPYDVWMDDIIVDTKAIGCQK